MATAAWPAGASVSHGSYMAQMTPGFPRQMEKPPLTVGLGIPPGMSNYRSHIDQLSRFFGQPRRDVPLDDEDYYDKEYLDLPDAYRGKNTAVLRVLIDMITQAELFPITVMFPLTRKEDSMTISWEVLVGLFQRL
jgi:hypothetical protein